MCNEVWKLPRCNLPSTIDNFRFSSLCLKRANLLSNSLLFIRFRIELGDCRLGERSEENVAAMWTRTQTNALWRFLPH